MKEETKSWLEKAKEDLRTAEYLKEERYEAATFYCQQAVEKALKAFSIERKGKFRKVHDLKLLAKEINLPEKFVPICEKLSLAYVYARYPDVPKVSDTKKEALEFLDKANQIVKWIEKKL